MPEPVLGYPVDESPYGAFDLCGSVAEWLDSWWVEERRLRRFVGGSAFRPREAEDQCEESQGEGAANGS